MKNSDAAADDPDARLLRAHARGDPQAFGDLLDRYRSRILHLVRCRVGAGSLWVEDVAQDVFVQVHRKAGTFEGQRVVFWHGGGLPSLFEGQAAGPRP